MANFYLVGNSRFNPFSYQELLQPALMATQAHQDIESQYAELATKANVWNEMANEQTDPYAYKMYKTYSNDLEKQAEQLAKEGLNPASRQNMLRMRQRYSSDIVPIEQAHKRRQELIDEQRKLLAQDNTLMFDRDASIMSLDDLIKSPNLSYSPVSGKDLYNKGKEAAISASSRVTNISPALQGQYWRIRQGYGEEMANKFLLDQSNIPELKEAINRIVSQSNVTDNNKERAINYTISGIMSGLSIKDNYQADRGYVDPAERERLSLAKAQFKWSKDKWEEEQLGIKLPNGDRVKDIGSGRVRITHPDGRVEVIAASNIKKTKDEKIFSGLQFKMWNDSGSVNDFQEGLTNNWSYKRKGFTEGDEKEISYTDLSKTMQTNLAAKLAEYGLTFDDVEIWKDEDSATDNHYQVRLKQNNKEQVPEEFGNL